METCRIDRIGLAAQDWLVPAPGKIVVTSAKQESEEGREEGSWMSEHLSAEEEKTRTCLTRIDENRERRKEEETGTNCHTKYHPQPDPRPAIDSTRRPQNLTRLHTAESDRRMQDIGLQDLATSVPPRSALQPYYCHRSAAVRPLLPECHNQTIIVRVPQPDNHYQSASIRLPPSECLNQTTTIGALVPQPDHCYLGALLTTSSAPENVHKPEHLITWASQPDHYVCMYQSHHLSGSTYCMKGQCIIQQQHGNYTDIEPNSFRSGDDWPD
jgi:hypothetical protein